VEVVGFIGEEWKEDRNGPHTGFAHKLGNRASSRRVASSEISRVSVIPSLAIGYGAQIADVSGLPSAREASRRILAFFVHDSLSQRYDLQLLRTGDPRVYQSGRDGFRR
jgi:hypothetical protein